MSSNPTSNNGKSEKVLGLIMHTQWNQKLYNEMMRNLVVYGISNPYIYKDVTRWQRFKWRVRSVLHRVRDAWLVLIGRADIYDGQDD